MLDFFKPNIYYISIFYTWHNFNSKTVYLSTHMLMFYNN